MMVVKRSARVILVDGSELILMKRTKPGQAPYWVTVGGGVEADDPSIEDALHREVFEELGATLICAELAHLISTPVEGRIAVQHIFARKTWPADQPSYKITRLCNSPASEP